MKNIPIAFDELSQRDLKDEQEALLDSIWVRHTAFSSSDNLPREEIYQCDVIHYPDSGGI